MAKGKKSSLAIAKEKKRNSPQKLGKFETWVHRTMDYFTGVDSFNDKGEYIGHIKTPRLTEKQFEVLKEESPSSAKEYQRDPAKWWKNITSHYKGGMVKKKKMNMGGLTGRKVNPSTGLAMNKGGLTKRKVNPSTGLAMNKGGMTDYRKSGMFKK